MNILKNRTLVKNDINPLFTNIPVSDDIVLRISLIFCATCGATRNACRPAKPAAANPRPTTTILA